MDRPTVRVLIVNEDTGSVTITPVNLEARMFKNYIGFRYIRNLPDKLVERLMLLKMTDSEPPTEWIEDVGRRISQKMFWIYID